MSLLDYFLRRRKPSKLEAPDPIPRPAPTREIRDRVSLGDLFAQARGMGEIALLFQRGEYAWQWSARRLAEIVAEVIMPDASPDERSEYAEAIAFEIMQTERAYYEKMTRR